jgi:hypothetical protein
MACPQRAFNDHGEVKAGEITVKPAREVFCQSWQNPSDPEAGYSGHKGQGYQAQLLMGLRRTHKT